MFLLSVNLDYWFHLVRAEQEDLCRSKYDRRSFTSTHRACCAFSTTAINANSSTNPNTNPNTIATAAAAAAAALSSCAKQPIASFHQRIAKPVGALPFRRIA
mmetsp:Transcript_502/g.1058  ORF Transcript_502/g.1058 Transcript_502/m.1058 type:complete len:102 (-) Transcript_502:649-954(-)